MAGLGRRLRWTRVLAPVRGRSLALFGRRAKEVVGPLAQLFLDQLKFELESIDIPPLGDGEFGGQRLEPTMQVIVFILKKLGDLSQAFNIGFSINVDHMQS